MPDSDDELIEDTIVKPDASMLVINVAAPVRQQVTAALRSAIVAGRFEPGGRLIEKELCELTGSSRTSVREALRQLEAEGLVQMVPNRGPVVASIGAEEGWSIFEVRAALEALAGGLFAQNASAQQISALDRAVKDIATAYLSRDIEDIVGAKDRFYEILFEGSGNAIARSVLRMMHARINLLRRVSLSKASRHAVSLREIKEIVKAIKARDPDRATAACMTHVQCAAEAALGPKKVR